VTAAHQQRGADKRFRYHHLGSPSVSARRCSWRYRVRRCRLVIATSCRWVPANVTLRVFRWTRRYFRLTGAGKGIQRVWVVCYTFACRITLDTKRAWTCDTRWRRFTHL